MDHLLSKQNLEWRNLAREVARKHVLPTAWRYDRLQEYPWDVKEAIADAGLMRVWIPKEYGGAGFGITVACVQANLFPLNEPRCTIMPTPTTGGPAENTARLAK